MDTTVPEANDLTPLRATPREIEELVERLLAASGRRLDRSEPFVDARLADGSRLHCVIPEYKQMTFRSWTATTRLLALLDERGAG